MNEALPEVQPAKTIISIGNLPETATAVFEYVRTLLIVRATPLKVESMGLQAHATLIPEKWDTWDTKDCEAATTLYDMIARHEKKIEDEIGDIINKAHKLHSGMTAARKDIYAGISSGDKKAPMLKENLMESIRRWRNREEEKAVVEARRLDDIKRKEAEEKLLAEALERQKEADALKAEGHTELAAEVAKEANAILEEEVFVPPTVLMDTTPKGGPKRQKYWKFQVIDFSAVQDDYKLINESKIKRQVANQELKHGIKGIKVWQE